MIGDEKYFVIPLAIFMFVLSSGCGTDFHNGERPIDYSPAIWVSEEPKMWFEVGNRRSREVDGYLILDGQRIKVNVFFDRGRSVFILRKNDENPDEDLIIIHGLCVFRPDKLTVSIKKEDDKIFNGQYKKIIFIREPVGNARAPGNTGGVCRDVRGQKGGKNL
jgi:hypothetical protein